MKPLREQKVFASESERELAELFMAAERYRPSPFSKRRINAQLASAGRRRILRTWQPAVSAALFLAGSAAAATLGHRWLSEERPAEQPPLVLQQPMQSAHEPAAAPKALVPRPASEPPAQEQVVASPASEPSAQRQKAAKPAANSKPKQTSSAPKASVGEDPTHVAEALRALRKEGNPKRAQGLLADYLKANPNGALSEEALALTIEAAHARRDPKAETYARRYLARYPNGRHQALARRVLNQ